MEKEVMRNKLLILADRVRAAVQMENVTELISIMGEIKTDTRQRSIIGEYAKTLCIERITEHIKANGGKTLVVTRKGMYHEDLKDWYTLDGDTLKRNGTDVKWSSLLKLYVAYKQVINK